jgi:hypothetical protein
LEDSNILASEAVVGAIGAGLYLHQNPQAVYQVIKAGSKLFGSGSKKLESAGKGPMLEKTLAGGSMLRDTVTDSINPSLIGEHSQSIYHGSVRGNYVPSSLRRPKPGTMRDRLSIKLRDLKWKMRHMKVKMTGRRGRSKQPWGGDSQQPAVFSPDRRFFYSPKASGSSPGWLDESDDFIPSRAFSSRGKSGEMPLSPTSPTSQAGKVGGQGMAEEVGDNMKPSIPTLKLEAFRDTAPELAKLSPLRVATDMDGSLVLSPKKTPGTSSAWSDDDSGFFTPRQGASERVKKPLLTRSAAPPGGDWRPPV